MKVFKYFILLCTVALLAVLGVQVKLGYDKYVDALEKSPLSATIADLQAKEGYTPYSDTPKRFFQAVVAVEDRRFLRHNGVDMIGTGRAVIRNIKARDLIEGGSTISQQLAKNLFFPLDLTLERKIAETFMALKIEKEYSKEQILEFYANAVYFGSGHTGIREASEGYFNKPPAEMNDFECTLLAGILNAPSVYSLDVNPELALKRQKTVINCMKECGYISDHEAEVMGHLGTGLFCHTSSQSYAILRFSLQKNIRPLPCSSFSEKGHGKPLGSLVNALAVALLPTNLFRGMYKKCDKNGTSPLSHLFYPHLNFHITRGAVSFLRRFSVL